jgi:hypothetical protein
METGRLGAPRAFTTALSGYGSGKQKPEPGGYSWLGFEVALGAFIWADEGSF